MKQQLCRAYPSLFAKVYSLRDRFLSLIATLQVSNFRILSFFALLQVFCNDAANIRKIWEIAKKTLIFPLPTHLFLTFPLPIHIFTLFYVCNNLENGGSS